LPEDAITAFEALVQVLPVKLRSRLRMEFTTVTVVEPANTALVVERLNARWRRGILSGSDAIHPTWIDWAAGLSDMSGHYVVR